tara:strand:- start:163 stop:372 length:210 start_codon:yes stop_codon:yes gene_type:complete
LVCFISLLGALVSPSWATHFLFACPKRKWAKKKGTLHHRRWQKDAIDPLCASQETAREKLACGSNSFSL